MIVCFVDICGIVNNHCLEEIVVLLIFVELLVITFHQYQESKQSPLNSDG
jgi:hypothetical protein